MPSDTNVYWDSLDFDSEDDNSDFSSSSEQTLKNYIDPWDLENYAYVRKHLEESTPDPVTDSPTLTAEPADSTFYYISGTGTNRRKGNSLSYQQYPNETYGTVTKYAGFDEINFRNEQIYSSSDYSSRAESFYNVKKPRSERQIYNENIYGDKLVKRNPYDHDYSDLDTSSDFKEDSTHQALVQQQSPNISLDKPVKRRRSVLTESIIAKTLTIVKPRRHSVANTAKSTKIYNNKNGSQNQIYSSSKSMYNYKDPSPYYDSNNIYNVKMNKINENITDESIYEPYSTYSRYFDPYSTNSLTSMPIYDEASSTLRRRKPQNFGLSNYGHLKIDYSFNWNTLDRFIGK